MNTQKGIKLELIRETKIMNRKNTSQRKSDQSKSSEKKASGIFQQMETLQREILVLAKRAEQELDAHLLVEPAPVARMLESFARRVKATEAMVCFDSRSKKFERLEGFSQFAIQESDLMQCDLALSGREMTFDFANSRIFLPVVVFENPVAVAVFKCQSLSLSMYESVCAAASEGICSLRNEMKMNCGKSEISGVAS
jgi:hypothetical protein